MARKKKIPEESITLWARTLPDWKRIVLKKLATADQPVTTGELVELLAEHGIQPSLSALYNFLSRLERKGLLTSVKVFMANKRAWRVRSEYREPLTKALG